ncbi:MAG: Primosomal protein N' [Chlamydiae bacterium]|nr:Primosomal protein N' [Chlamydiota bacterium]
MSLVKTYHKYVSVVLEISLNKALAYGVPDELISQIQKGMKVSVPVRGRLQTGYIIDIMEEPGFEKVLPITKVHEQVVIEKDLFELGLWMAKYYGAPLRNIFKVMLPSSVRKEAKHKEQLYVMRGQTREQLRELCIELRKKSPGQAQILDGMLNVKKGILLTELLELTNGTRSQVKSLVKKGALVMDIVRVDRSPLVNEDYFRTSPKELNHEQQHAHDKILTSLLQNRFQTHLIFGITGSGKTEIYLQAIDVALKRGQGSIMMVPEISLTTQMIERFRSRFEGSIAILHYRLSQGERFDEWKRVQSGEAKIVIGPRSAIFSPVQNLGLIIVDEEHEQTYKQTEESPYYNARDVAVMRGKFTDSTVILGSATPSLESYYNAEEGKYLLSSLNNRADTAQLPEVKIIDMKHEYEKAKGYTIFSDALLSGIKSRWEKGEQSLLFLNRRGFHTSMICQKCREPLHCHHCDVALTFHKGTHLLKCHLCGYELYPPKHCPQCGDESVLKFKGVGTEQVQKALHAIFPDIRTVRVDADTTKHKGSHQKLLREFSSGKADVLIGTQMIAKGLHFPQVTLVGVLNSDGALNIPDFRAAESVFQIITQVAGRSGRGVSKGEVILQSAMPENATIQLAATQNYLDFYREELAVREIFQYPPFTHIAKMTFSGTDCQKVLRIAEAFRHELIKNLPSNFEILPVVPSGYAKVKDRYRYQFIIKGNNIYYLTEKYHLISHNFSKSGIRFNLDIDTSSTYF